MVRKARAIPANRFGRSIHSARRSTGGQCSAQIGVARVSFAVPVVASEKMPEMTPGSMNISPGAAKMNASAQCHPHTVMAPKNAPTVIGKVNRRNTAANTAARAQTAPR
jgi:hypothetical protein